MAGASSRQSIWERLHGGDSSHKAIFHIWLYPLQERALFKETCPFTQLSNLNPRCELIFIIWRWRNSQEMGGLIRARSSPSGHSLWWQTPKAAPSRLCEHLGCVFWGCSVCACARAPMPTQAASVLTSECIPSVVLVHVETKYTRKPHVPKIREPLKMRLR